MHPDPGDEFGVGQFAGGHGERHQSRKSEPAADTHEEHRGEQVNKVLAVNRDPCEERERGGDEGESGQQDSLRSETRAQAAGGIGAKSCQAILYGLSRSL